MLHDAGANRRLLLRHVASARHHHAGTHEARYARNTPGLFSVDAADGDGALADSALANQDAPSRASVPAPGLTPLQRQILDTLERPSTADALAASLSLSPESLRAQITMLEVLGRITRRGSLLERCAPR